MSTLRKQLLLHSYLAGQGCGLCVCYIASAGLLWGQWLYFAWAIAGFLASLWWTRRMFKHISGFKGAIALATTIQTVVDSLCIPHEHNPRSVFNYKYVYRQKKR